MDKRVNIGIYRILRKLGVTREYIKPEAQFKNDLFFDDIDWNFFMFFIESKFRITIPKEEEVKVQTIENSINIVNKHLHEYLK